ncbi:MAG: hypothetical protein GY699_17550, partial [Desulfobacteraceae bacterium]|nr:hypothetical protein [Desulfobacteraceae bacterium]
MSIKNLTIQNIHFVWIILFSCFTIGLFSNQSVQAAQVANINIINGNNYEQAIDVAFSSPFQNGFTFKRHYNSQSTIDSTIGFGWSHNYDMVLTPNFMNSSYLLKIKGMSGRGYYFGDYDLDGTFDSYFQDNSTIIQDGGNNYIWTREDGTVYKFNDTGVLLSITDKNSNI